MPQVQHRLIIRHPRQPTILAVDNQGAVRLPAFTWDDRHTAEVDYINAAARDRFGLATTVLRGLDHSDPRGSTIVRDHELVALGEGALASPELSWRDPRELASLLDGADRALVTEWLAASNDDAVDGREWTRPGWLGEVQGWIEAALHDHGLGEVGEVVQLRTWPSSCVLRVVTAGGIAYFKAVAASNRQECPVTAYLARHFPDAVPRVIAAEPERRWLLMAECPGRNLEEIADVAVWERAARSYARLQVACAPRTRDLAARGCEQRSLQALATAIEPLVADPAALRSGGPADLTAAELDALRTEVPALRRRCAALADAGVPLTLEHGDLWPGNFLVDGERCAVLDWEDVSIAHPFLSLAPLAVGLGIYQGEQASPESVARLERAYLEPFAALLPMARLQDALQLARPLSFLDMAARYRQQRPSVTRLHPWMRDLVPEALRLALAEAVR